MDGAPPKSRLHECIRDLAALNALPSMCIGRSTDEVLDIVIDALPTALSCELVLLTSADGRERASLGGKPVVGPELAALRQARARAPDAAGVIALEEPKLWCVSVELPVGAARGRLVAGKRRPLDPDTDRILIRSAANLIGTTLETAAVLEAAKRKDEFLAMLGHELRNPLAPILTAVELLSTHSEVARERAVIERHTRHLTRLVDDLLDISRIAVGRIELRQERVALRSVLERGIELASPLMTRHRHKLVFTTQGDVTIEGDPVRLAQVFGNILTNAAKFTPPGGTIKLSFERANERVRVSVRDDGRGIAADQLTKVFEPFVQVHRVTDTARGGLGLGLAIVKNLVERHDGRITAESDGPGQGSTFIVDLPAVAAPSPESSVKMVDRARLPRREMRVLVVDDNVDVADLLSEALSLRGFETSVAYDAQTAIESWRRFSPHAAVLDVGLPDVDGYELARTLRAEHGGGPILIAATGYGQQSDRQQAADAGFDCHFVKPVSVQDLVRALDAHVADRPTT